MNIVKDKLIYKTFVDENIYDIPVYFYPQFLDVVCSKNWSSFVVLENEEPIACFYYSEKKQFIFNYAVNPQLSQYTGFWLKASKQDRYEKVVKFLMGEIKEYFLFTSFNLHYSYPNHLPWQWGGFHQRKKHTFIIDHDSYPNIYGKYAKQVKSSIRYASQELEIINISDVNKIMNLLIKKARVTEDIIIGLSNLEHTKMYACVDNHGENVAAILTVEDSKFVYNLINGRHAYAKRGAMSMLIDHAIKYAITKNKSFDFEGSLLPGVYEYFESFGGRVVSYHNLYYCKNRLMLSFLRSINKI